jgi:hypothetical protein
MTTEIKGAASTAVEKATEAAYPTYTHTTEDGFDEH